ncbi:MAG: hypothetical protein AB9836_01445 [Aminipila sp.]
MACFLVPLGEVIITTAVQKVVEKNERRTEKVVERNQSKVEKVWHSENNKAEAEATLKTCFSWSQKLSWLNRMLWGGVILLAFEHLWHGEIVPWPPFLTAMNNPADIGPMLHEIATFGTSMALFITIIWTIMVMIADQKSKTALERVKSEA